MPLIATIGTQLPRRGRGIGLADRQGALFAHISPDHFAALEIRHSFTGAHVIGYEDCTFAERLRGRRVDRGRSDQQCGRVPVNRIGLPAILDARIDLARNAAERTSVSSPTTLEGPGSDGR